MSTETAERPVWSKSQMSALRECRRKLLFSVKPADAKAPVMAEAAKLKKVRPRQMWAGALVHETIGDILKSVRQGQKPEAADVIVDKLKNRMRDEFRASKDGSAEAPLLEHRYQAAVAPDVWRRQWDGVEKSIRWFLGSKWLSRLASLGPECWKAVDEVLSFDVDGIKAYAKIDCAVEIDGKFFVIDWRTSAPNPQAEAGLQVAALYAYENWGADPESLQAITVCLLDGATYHADVTEDSLMETHLRIQEEAGQLQVAAAQFPADPFALPAAPLSTCARCQFQALCHPGGLAG